MLPDQSRSILTGDYATDWRLLQERLDRTPVFEAKYHYDGSTGIFGPDSAWHPLGSPVLYKKAENWTWIESHIWMTQPFNLSNVMGGFLFGWSIDGAPAYQVGRIDWAQPLTDRKGGYDMNVTSGFRAGNHTFQLMVYAFGCSVQVDIGWYTKIVETFPATY